MNIELKTLEETEAFAAAFWKALPKKCVVFLHGQLGAGKTTLVRGILRAAGHKGAVKSPTYTLVEEYDIASKKIFHFDLYRLEDPEELEMIGIRDYFEEDCLLFIEWPERGQDFLPEADFMLSLSIQAQGRILRLSKMAESPQKNIQLHWKNKDLLL